MQENPIQEPMKKLNYEPDQPCMLVAVEDFQRMYCEIEMLRKDAARYRFIRANHTVDIGEEAEWESIYVVAGDEPIPSEPGALDHVIDSAMGMYVN